MSTPSSTYRLQLSPAFTAAQAAQQVEYLRCLGVGAVYLSPIGQAVPGSTHGYDCINPGVLDAQRDQLPNGEPGGFSLLWQALREHGLQVVLDLVPNHQGIPAQSWRNPSWHQLLLEGPRSEAAATYDVDWQAGQQEGSQPQIVLPFLPHPLDECVQQGLLQLGRDGQGQPALLYDGPHGWSFPLRAGTQDLPLQQCVHAQHYRLRGWDVSDDDGEPLPNYRRFFTVSTLIGVRVEDRQVFTATVTPALRLVPLDLLAGVRVDHVDGLADPAGFLTSLRAILGPSRWVVVEKILCQPEVLASDWPCDGTSGYDVMARVSQVLTHPGGASRMRRDYRQLTGKSQRFTDVARLAQHQAAQQFLPEAAWLTRLLQLTPPELEPALAQRLATVLKADPVRLRHAVLDACASLNVYRLYPTGASGSAVQQWASRWAQTTGPIMAKGVEDCAFYRWNPHPHTNEVGSSPVLPSCTVAQWWRWVGQQHQRHPLTMSTLSTHDTKRSQDVRARLIAVTELPRSWHRAVCRWERRAARLPGFSAVPASTRLLLWHSLVGVWPWTPSSSLPAQTGHRLVEYLTKAEREAGQATGWNHPDVAYEQERDAWVQAVLADRALVADVGRFVAQLHPSALATVLSQSLLHLLGPGVADVYQGSEVLTDALVDPDNRRLVDFARLQRLLAGLDEAELASLPAGQWRRDGDSAKLRLTRIALQLRREHPQLFAVDAVLEPLPCGSDHALAWARSAADGSGPIMVAVATRLPATLARRGGWADHSVSLPQIVGGGWRHLLTNAQLPSSDQPVKVAQLLNDWPVAVLITAA